MKIKLRLSASEDKKQETVTIEDLGYDKKSWSNLSEDEKQDELRGYIDNLPDQPFWVIDESEEI